MIEGEQCGWSGANSVSKSVNPDEDFAVIAHLCSGTDRELVPVSGPQALDILNSRNSRRAKRACIERCRSWCVSLAFLFSAA